MNKGKVLLATVLLIFLTSVFLLRSISDPPINWNDSFYKSDNIPKGSKIFHEAFKSWAGDERFVEVNLPVFEFLRDTTIKGTYFLFNRNLSWNATTTHKLMDWVAAGNTLFLAGSDLDEFLLDTLGLIIEKRLESGIRANSVYLDLVNPHLNPNMRIQYEREEPFVVFTGMESIWPIRVLGRGTSVSLDELPDWSESDINFVSVEMGEGTILLHTYPAIFTNYFLLKEDNLSYIRGVLAYLPNDNPLYVDNYYKVGKSFYSSPLYVLLGNRSLKMAYYILLALLVLWVFFVGKRRQAAIPVILPPKNQSLAFADTLASMYLAKGDHKAMAIHQINYLFEYLRRTHHMGTEQRDSEWRRRLSEKFGETLSATEKAFDFIDELLKSKTVTPKELLLLNKLVTNYTHRHDSTT